MDKDIQDEFNKVNGRLDELFNRLFVGNGKTSWDVRLDRLEGFKKLVCWAVGIVYIAIVGFIVSIFKK